MQERRVGTDLKGRYRDKSEGSFQWSSLSETV